MSEDQHETIHYTADVVLAYHADDDMHVLLIQRKYEPFTGHWALPGGHVDRGETARDAAVRELFEEAGISIEANSLVELGVFDQPDRDPRGRYVSVAYFLFLDTPPLAAAGSDALQAKWIPSNSQPTLAFDHRNIIEPALDRAWYEVSLREEHTDHRA